jgi:cell wall-associated NlpC family hydrolase
MAAKNKSGGGGRLLVAGAVALALAGGVKHHGHGILAQLTSAGSGNHSAAQAIKFAWSKVGLPYCWGGTGPSCYDCSGLTSEAYGLPSSDRTAAQQWAGLPHVRHPRPGDLVFAPGSDGSASSPGHVGLVIRGGRVIQAYGTGTSIEVSSLRAFAAGAGGITGYARPGGA